MSAVTLAVTVGAARGRVVAGMVPGIQDLSLGFAASRVRDGRAEDYREAAEGDEEGRAHSVR